MRLYSLGEEIKAKTNSYLKSNYDIKECNEDFSILAQNDVKFALFCLNNDNYAFYLACCKTCIHLNKKLIVLTPPGIHKDKILNKINIIHIDNLEDDTLEKLSDTISEVLHQAEINNKLTNITNAKHKDVGHGTKIDIYKVVNYIDKNLHVHIREDEAAKSCHYSTPYFSKVFHQTLGISFRDYVINKRINKAKELLSGQRAEKIASIAYQCGYSDVSYFSRIFKKKTGLTPNEYRNTLPPG